MDKITQFGNGNQASAGNNSPNLSNSCISITNLEKSGWFLSGLVIPVVAGLIVEYLSSGSVSMLFKSLLDFFK